MSPLITQSSPIFGISGVGPPGSAATSFRGPSWCPKTADKASPTAESTLLSTLIMERLTEGMKFNDGHLMSIITYGILMVVSAVGNITVLVNILRRRRALRFGIHYMFMHLAIADLLVSRPQHLHKA
jgi:hypothetical protein